MVRRGNVRSSKVGSSSARFGVVRVQEFMRYGEVRRGRVWLGFDR